MSKANTVADSIRARPAKRAGETAVSGIAKGSTKGCSLVPKNGNDRINTADSLAHDIVAHFRRCGRILEPAAGKVACLRALPPCEWCEIDRGVGFFDCTDHYDWIVTDPPYSLLTYFPAKAGELFDNSVFLWLRPTQNQRRPANR